VFAFWIAEHFDVVKQIASSFVSGFVCSSPDAFAFQQVEKALVNGIIMAVSTAAHAVFQIVLL
jgi:hypothetical protein